MAKRFKLPPNLSDWEEPIFPAKRPARLLRKFYDAGRSNCNGGDDARKVRESLNNVLFLSIVLGI